MTLICIDPGHAASTAGKRSPDGSLREYEFNRAVGRRLAYHLERHGMKIMYSCDINAQKDADVSDRCKAANNAGADLYISLHANAFEGDWNNISGWEIYFNTGSAKGKTLADAIHSHSKLLGITDRGVKAGEWYVIKYTDMPAVLIEHDFMTNLASAERLKASEWRDKWAIANAKGILDYLGVEWVEEKVHWAEKHLDNLVAKGIINSPEAHRDSLDSYMTKGQIFAMLDRITDK